MKKLLVFFIAISMIGCGKNSGSLGINKVTPSGFDYVVHQEGEGRSVKYGEVAYFKTIEIIDDTLMTENSNFSGRISKIPVLRPEENNQYGPIVDVLKELKIGDSVSVTFTFDQLRMRPGSPIFGHIKYDIKLIDLRSQRAFKAEQDSIKDAFEFRKSAISASAPAAEALLLKTIQEWPTLDIDSTPGGIQYLIHEPGDGPMAEISDTLAVYFIGAFDDGTIFDNSIEAGVPFWFLFGRGGVIPAWDEVFAYIPEGSKATMFVPYHLAYGIAGSPPKIPESQDLFFYVEVGTKDLEELKNL